MSNTTSKTRTVRLADAKKGDTVRLFDPKSKTWGNVVVGTKKGDKVIARVRKAQAERAKPEVQAERASKREALAEQRENAQRFNRNAASWMREEGLVPNGQAWAAVKAGERDVKVLRSLNKADGLAPKAPVAPKAEKAPKARKAAKATAPKADKPKGKKAARKARSEAAKRGWETRRANAGTTPAPVTPVTEAPTPRLAVEVDLDETALRKVEFVSACLALELTAPQIERAWALEVAKG